MTFKAFVDNTTTAGARKKKETCSFFYTSTKNEATDSSHLVENTMVVSAKSINLPPQQRHDMAGSRLHQRYNRGIRSCGRHHRPICIPQALFGGLFGGDEEKEREKEEQYRAQQEVLNRRKTNSWQKGVQERRQKASRYLNDPDFKKQCDEENRKKFLAKKAEEGPEPKFGIIIPIIPVGIPEYDGGERFDLRLPYVDNGWVDDDADAFKQFKRFIGLEKKNENKSEKKMDKKPPKKK